MQGKGDSCTGTKVQDCSDTSKSTSISAVVLSELARLWPKICKHKITKNQPKRYEH